MKTIEKLLQAYHSRQSNMQYRFSQWFLNEYGWHLGICPWDALYYEEDIVKAIDKINMWLMDNGYANRPLPKPKTEQETNK